MDINVLSKYFKIECICEIQKHWRAIICWDSIFKTNFPFQAI